MSGETLTKLLERHAWALVARADRALARVQVYDRRVGVLLCKTESFQPQPPWASVGPAHAYRSGELCGAYVSVGPLAFLVTWSHAPEWSRSGRLVSRPTPWPGLRPAA